MVTTRNPYSETVLKEYPYLTDSELQMKLQNANESFLKFSQLKLEERKKLSRAIAKSLQDHEVILAESISKETGKPITDSTSEVKKCASAFETFPDLFQESDFIQKISGNYDEVQIHKVPMGSVLCIMPWNYPLWQLTRSLVANLLVGNITLLKHSEITWGTADLFTQIFTETSKALNLPRVLFHLRIPESDVEKVLSSSFVVGLAFTGSVKGGKAVASLAGKHLKKCVLELGGSDAYLVLPDADLVKTAQTLVNARLTNFGQACISAKRIFVPAPFGDDVARLLGQIIVQKKFGDPLLPQTELGTLAQPRFVEQLRKQVQLFKSYGGRVVFEHGPDVESSSHYPVQIILMPRWVRELRNEELFGPVFVIYEYSDLQTAISEANDTSYGLGAAVFSKDEELAIKVGQQLRCGVLAINDFIRTDPRVPFGGVADSGYGRELGLLGAFEFVNHKSVLINRST